jgi:hypothetical protein
MIRLTDEQWERIRNHFPEEHIADGRDPSGPSTGGRASVLSAILAILLAMSLGFSAILLIAIALYLVAAAALR